MGPYDPENIELFGALEYVEEQIERFGEQDSRDGWEPLIEITHWQAW